MSKIIYKHKGQDCYVIDCILVKDGLKTMRVSYQGKPYFFVKKYCEFIAPGRCAMQIEYHDIMFNQDKFKKTVMVKQTFIRNMGHVPKPRLRRISKN